MTSTPSVGSSEYLAIIKARSNAGLIPAPESAKWDDSSHPDFFKEYEPSTSLRSYLTPDDRKMVADVFGVYIGPDGCMRNKDGTQYIGKDSSIGDFTNSLAGRRYDAAKGLSHPSDWPTATGALKASDVLGMFNDEIGWDAAAAKGSWLTQGFLDKVLAYFSQQVERTTGNGVNVGI